MLLTIKDYTEYVDHIAKNPLESCREPKYHVTRYYILGIPIATLRREV